jgi:hypothetical protein
LSDYFPVLKHGRYWGFRSRTWRRWANSSGKRAFCGGNTSRIETESQFWIGCLVLGGRFQRSDISPQISAPALRRFSAPENLKADG